MAFTHNLSLTWSSGSESVGSTVVVTGDGEINLEISVPASTTDQAVVVAIDQSAMLSLFMKADGALTVETNSSSAPTNTFALPANSPIIWYSTGLTTNPITADVTSMFLTNAGSSAVTFSFRCLYNA